MPAYSPVNPYCHVEPGITTRFTGAGTYTVPKIDVQLAATFQSSPAEPLAGELDGVERDRRADAGPAALRQRAQRHGEPAGARIRCAGPRVNQLDFRVGKVLRFGGQRATVSLDLFNALNADTVLTYNQAFIAAAAQWLVPNTVLTARTAKITVQYRFLRLRAQGSGLKAL